MKKGRENGGGQKKKNKHISTPLRLELMAYGKVYELMSGCLYGFELI